MQNDSKLLLVSPEAHQKEYLELFCNSQLQPLNLSLFFLWRINEGPKAEDKANNSLCDLGLHQVCKKLTKNLFAIPILSTMNLKEISVIINARKANYINSIHLQALLNYVLQYVTVSNVT